MPPSFRIFLICADIATDLYFPDLKEIIQRLLIPDTFEKTLAGQPHHID